ncbi:hypothetical protein COV22_02040 [Candidatus Woesearchaeota archaeon CG10_big_fil_rev_8_21_14_0_10_47_5]|nr:MAG: hypothetical protein COV22_02040 [Candidatus Woesearchaeota archaeon CG10_big_fil_rev_8_21_14_0_10_47_5]
MTSTRRYIITGIITIMVFSLGLMLGMVMESRRISYVQKERQEQKLDFASLQLQYTFIDQLGAEGNCPALLETFDKNVRNLETIRLKLEAYDQRATVSRDDFEMLKREYTQAQLQYWFLAKKIKVLCNAELSTILYFFSTKKECPDCENQAFVLTYLKERFGDKLLNFALDGRSLNEPIVNMLKDAYKVTVFPTLIIDNKRFEGFTSKEEIMREVCVNSTVWDCVAYQG